MKCFGLCREESVLRHASVVFSQKIKGCSGRNQLQPTSDRSQIVDLLALRILFRKEHAFVAGDSTRKGMIANRSISYAGGVEAGEVVPVTGKSVTPHALLLAEDVYGGGLLPEGAFCMHNSGNGCWETHPFDGPRRVTNDAAH